MNAESKNDECSNVFEETLINLRDRMLAELSRMDNDAELENATSEQRLKYMSGYFKTLQGIEAMVRQIWEKRGEPTVEGIDVVEFRQQLEIQIEKLVDDNTSTTISGGAE